MVVPTHPSPSVFLKKIFFARSTIKLRFSEEKQISKWRPEETTTKRRTKRNLRRNLKGNGKELLTKLALGVETEVKFANDYF